MILALESIDGELIRMPANTTHLWRPKNLASIMTVHVEGALVDRFTEEDLGRSFVYSYEEF